MVLVDATDSIRELERKISATQREINARYLNQDELENLDERKIMCALTKIESLTTEQLLEKKSIVKRHGYSSLLAISVHQEIGLEEFQDAMLKQLFGNTVTI